MKIFFINTDYYQFINHEYKENPNLKNKNYDKQLSARYDSFFGVSNFYSKNINRLNHSATDILANHQYIQKQWAKENGFKYFSISDKIARLPYLRRYAKQG
jgi:uncharacterized protein (UPF0332 family)